ncbi:SgcJ/EcaC family oxidoreductase [Rudanella paleaurantiibacter]|uniref:SgcJ/EcaC family oxidoreductase n=1 Tax=Rudanella paleaurantiibacter TaxID=2614655 RepID=A0A7J5TZU9_9BACT|nr:SgcJ/EcaC family oxidoreductase [Rudanella paleaurantiibacter]KAB7731018.1 SgcJ/EcaC family oxidoreductase [Rudanella paleaurantiibacter]
MKYLLCVGLTVALLNTAFGQSADKKADEVAIRATIDAMGKSWANHNYADIANWATPDIDWVNIVGMWWKGREEVRLAHQAFHDTFFKNTPWTLKNVTVRFVTPDVAIAHVLSHIGTYFPPDGIDHGTNKRPETDDMATLVLVKQSGKWLITAGENVEINEQAAADNPVNRARH